MPDNIQYDYKIKVGDQKAKVLKILGNPSHFNTNAFIYDSSLGAYSSFQQINIFFNENDKVDRVQFISWDGP